MAAPSPSAQDQSLSALVSAPDPNVIADVITRMQAIDDLLPDGDGVKWFNRLYLMVTRQVDTNPPGGEWQNPEWLLHLDVVFAGLYFGAVRNYLSGAGTASAWAALFESRYDPYIEHIQFALAGMNAHINHDLALAVLQTTPTSILFRRLTGRSMPTISRSTRCSMRCRPRQWRCWPLTR
jgi:hypothetical protein